MIRNFLEIIAWQKAHRLALNIYSITRKFPRFEEYGLANQMRRCAVSVPSNIAEGFKRKTVKDSAHFYNISEGSLEELKYQLILSRDLKYISNEIFEESQTLAEESGRTLNAWKKSQV